MKRLLLAVLLIGATVSAADIQWQPCEVQASGHTLKIGFRTDISTNDPGYWERKKTWNYLDTSGFATFISATNSYAYYTDWTPVEKPFPRTNINDWHWEVYSNTYALASCDGQTNTISESHVRLGDYFKKESTVISTQTNTVSAESFVPAVK